MRQHILGMIVTLMGQLPDGRLMIDLDLFHDAEQEPSGEE